MGTVHEAAVEELLGSDAMDFVRVGNGMEYQGGKEDWDKAAEIASLCSKFVEDDEDEQVAEERKSCYNCLYRRWTIKSFTCSQKK